MTAAGRRIEIRGTVQGVGFRPWVYRLARDLEVRGRVRNGARGVTIEAFGEQGVLDRFVEGLRADPPPAALIASLEWVAIPAEAVTAFEIVPSEEGEERRPSIPPDLATCPDCLAEVLDPADRRHGYAFTNCTNCGPRFTIARGVPYDRPATTMAAFPMCEACRREYESVDDRRFHAQPNACPECGPRLALLDAEGRALDVGDPLAEVVGLLQAGGIAAIKGLGGYHLACDALDDGAVRELRRRKRRDEKPFAVMVVDQAAAEALAEVDDGSRRLLESVERPIVLMPRREGCPLAPSVAPDCARVGLFLPYTPLHHLLMRAVGRPLVMTSGNVSDTPIASHDDEARQRLHGIADRFLTHDRAIENRADDSVAVVMAGRPVVLRRSRGYVPRPVRLARPLARPVLGCGADLKNTFCLAAGDMAFVGPHIGDLEDYDTFESFTAMLEQLERFVGIAPEVVAHDLHPRYHSTRYAVGRPAAATIGVQHHHAHVASAMAEHGLDGPVLGLAWDGTGWGPDGTAWGGELLLVERGAYEWLATTRPLGLAGGDTAVREVWRTALALLDDAFEGEAPLEGLALFDEVPAARVRLVRQMLHGSINTPLARGIGRYFDAFGALGLGRASSAFEGQVAMAWEQAADPDAPGAYPVAIDWTASPWTLDLRPAMRLAVRDLLDGRGPGLVSARFHRALVAAAAELIGAAVARCGRLPVVVTGGCFQNAWLTEGVTGELTPELDVVLHGVIPPNDGGVALGQVVVADAVARGEGHRRKRGA